MLINSTQWVCFAVEGEERRAYPTTAPQSYTAYRNNSRDHHIQPAQHKPAYHPRSHSHYTDYRSPLQFSLSRTPTESISRGAARNRLLWSCSLLDRRDRSRLADRDVSRICLGVVGRGCGSFVRACWAMRKVMECLLVRYHVGVEF